MIEISVNGTIRGVDDGTTVAGLARECGLNDKGGVAIALNDRLIPRSQWPSTVIEDGTDVLIIKAAYGG